MGGAQRRASGCCSASRRRPSGSTSLIAGVAQPLIAARAAALAAIARHDAALARLAALPEGDPRRRRAATTRPVTAVVDRHRPGVTT